MQPPNTNGLTTIMGDTAFNSFGELILLNGTCERLALLSTNSGGEVCEIINTSVAVSIGSQVGG